MSYTDPAVADAARRLNDSIDRLIGARLQFERIPIDFYEEPRMVTDGLMFSLAELSISSPELKAYAERVRIGECAWSDIENRSMPVPREVGELKASPIFIWYSAAMQTDHDQPYRIPWE
ncbi:hypothetical protein QM588_00225 [Rhodococcus sp. IEGM 1354]|uniref:hypothetical protein n=1 Tax=Rhodococcus sp. IEGM 1354 TaxID=3047088 RepID=UPI0024B6E790|nr:hypothetical protein [Rhodococcus sp. IEGM 1354]MDI9928813.1 hypothetical protein [Rhodococcus sp. IEGM 1354]